MNRDLISAAAGALGFGLVETDPVSLPRRPSSWVASPSPRSVRRQPGWACYATVADLVSGIDGGSGLILMAAAALNVSFSVRVRDPLDSSEALCPRFGRPALMSFAMRGLYDSLLISEPSSLGLDPDEAATTLSRLARLGIGVFSACTGWLTEEDLVR